MMNAIRSWPYLVLIFLLAICSFGQDFPDSDLTEGIIEIADVAPKLIDGTQNLYEEIASVLKYPVGCEKLEGRVYVQYVVEKNGSVSNAKIIKSLHPKMDKEVLRTIKEVFKTIHYTPGLKDGLPVTVKLTLPITIKISNQ